MRLSRSPKHTALLLVLSTIAGTPDRLLASAGVVDGPTETVVWKLDNLTSIGGQTPQVLGAPQIVAATAGGQAIRFNGRSDGLVFPLNPIAGWPRFTIEVLIRPDANGPQAQRFLHIDDGHGTRALLETRTAGTQAWILDTFLRSEKCHRTLRSRSGRHPAERWTWVALVYDGSRMTDYVDGVRQLEGRVVFPPMSPGSMSLGVRLNRVFWFKGCIQELRFHPASFAPEALQRVANK